MNSKWVVKIYNIVPRWMSARAVRWVSYTSTIGVVGVVFDDQGRVLALRHTYHKPPWRLPGGLLARREQPKTTVVREVWEEARCRVKPITVIDAAVMPYSFDVAILGELVEEHVFKPNAEIAERRWLNPDEIDILPKEHQALVEFANDWRKTPC